MWGYSSSLTPAKGAGQAKRHGDFRKANEALQAQPLPVFRSLESDSERYLIKRMAH